MITFGLFLMGLLSFSILFKFKPDSSGLIWFRIDMSCFLFLGTVNENGMSSTIIYSGKNDEVVH
jgi:hypothetical protein